METKANHGRPHNTIADQRTPHQSHWHTNYKTNVTKETTHRPLQTYKSNMTKETTHRPLQTHTSHTNRTLVAINIKSKIGITPYLLSSILRETMLYSYFNMFIEL